MSTNPTPQRQPTDMTAPDGADPTVERLLSGLHALYTEDEVPAGLRASAERIRLRAATERRRHIDGQRIYGQVHPMPALAATLLLIVVGAAVFGVLDSHRLGHGSSATPAVSGCQPSQITAAIPPHAQLNAIAMPSPDDGWAVGAVLTSPSQASDQPPASPASATLLLHYSHCRWEPEGPSYPGMELDSLSMVSATEGWATGSYPYGSGAGNGGDSLLLLHYTGGQWQRVTLPAALRDRGTIADIRMRSHDEGWLLLALTSGGRLPPIHSETLVHYVNGTWSAVATPYPFVEDMAPLGPGDLWIIGATSATGETSDLSQPTFFAHYEAGQWTTTPSPMHAGILHMISPRDGWAMGLVVPASNGYLDQRTVVMRYDGSAWTIVQISADPQAQFVQMYSDTNGWAYGMTRRTLAPGGSYFGLAIVQHYQGGRWQNVLPPFADLSYIRIFPVSDNEAWVIAERFDTSSTNGGAPDVGMVLLHYAYGTWGRYGG